MELFIKDLNGETYHFNQLTFKQTLELQKEISKYGDIEKNTSQQLEMSVDLFKKIFMLSNPNYPEEKFDEDVLEYNFSILGLEGFVQLINVVVEKVFHSKETTMSNPYPFLEKSMSEKN